MPRLSTPVNKFEHVLGPENAPVVMVEYGDFQCPHCGAAYPILTQIIQQMQDSLMFAYRHFPLTEEHPYALIAAEASEAAAAQGKFWEMYNQIFQNQELLDVDHLYEFAQTIGLDMNQFDQDMSEHVFEEKVRADFMGGVRSGVNGTPTLFLNGKRYDGPVEMDALLQAIHEAAEIAQE